MTGIALIGAGLVGRRHAEAIAAATGVDLVAVADPTPAGAELGAAHGVPHFADLDTLLDGMRPDGVLLATPNGLHEAGALRCIAQGLPVLVEKPLADTVAAAERIAAAGGRVLVGHHRRHNPIIARARAEIAGGALGRVVAVQGTLWLMKPDDYFAAAPWRSRAGGGPVMINLIHDIDLMRHLVGEITAVQAMLSNGTRGFEVEDTGAILFRFAGGALGTLSLSDTAQGPWSWELTAGENPAYPETAETSLWIGGTGGALAVPNLARWAFDGAASWWSPIRSEALTVAPVDPLVAQAAHFGAVIRGEADPLVTAADGLANQRVLEAVLKAAETGGTVPV